MDEGLVKPVIVKVTVDPATIIVLLDTTQSETVSALAVVFHLSDGLAQFVPPEIVGDATEKPEGIVMTKNPVYGRGFVRWNENLRDPVCEALYLLLSLVISVGFKEANVVEDTSI